MMVELTGFRMGVEIVGQKKGEWEKGIKKSLA
jgi:hypothetical protein